MVLKRGHLLRGTAATAIMACSILVLGTAPAQAHTRTEETTNVSSTITATPALPGVSWRVYTGGLLVEVEHRGTGTLIVHGYEGEPYLRITPDGVERNRRSPATYLNDERFGDVALPRDADASAPPEWVRVSDEPFNRWHDHRTHWMSPEPPAFVETGPLARAAMRAGLVGHIGRAGTNAGEITSWSIPVSYDGRPHRVEGVLGWEDPPRAWPWLVLALPLVVPALVGLRRPDRAGAVRPAAVVVGLVAVVSLLHLVDDLLAWPSPLLDDLFGVLHTTFFLLVGVAGAVWAWRAEAARVLSLAIGSGAVLYHQGLVHLPMLAAASFPTLWPQPLIRLSVAVGLLQAVAVAVVVVVASRHPAAHDPARPGAERVTTTS